MAASLKKLLKGSSSKFTKNYLMVCMAHVLSLAMQCGLKELGQDESYWNSEDDDKHIEGLEAISQNYLMRFSIDLKILLFQLIILLRAFNAIRICVMSWKSQIKIFLLRISEPSGI